MERTEIFSLTPGIPTRRQQIPRTIRSIFTPLADASYMHLTADSEYSIIGTFGKLIAPIFKPCGFGNWKVAVSLISGFAAKEAVVSTMSILYGAYNTADLVLCLTTSFTPLSAYSFLTFVLLYVPCIAAVSTLRSELNSRKLTAFSVLYQLSVAWIMSTLVFQIGNLFV